MNVEELLESTSEGVCTVLLEVDDVGVCDRVDREDFVDVLDFARVMAWECGPCLAPVGGGTEGLVNVSVKKRCPSSSHIEMIILQVDCEPEELLVRPWFELSR
jgi:hypothetical protein